MRPWPPTVRVLVGHASMASHDQNMGGPYVLGLPWSEYLWVMRPWPYTVRVWVGHASLTSHGQSMGGSFALASHGQGMGGSCVLGLLCSEYRWVMRPWPLTIREYGWVIRPLLPSW